MNGRITTLAYATNNNQLPDLFGKLDGANRSFKAEMDTIKEEDPNLRSLAEADLITRHERASRIHLDYYFSGRYGYVAHPKHQIFYNRFKSKLSGFYDAYKVLQTGLVQETATAEENALEAMSKIVALVPFPSAEAIFNVAIKDAPETAFKIAELVESVIEYANETSATSVQLIERKREKFNRQEICNRLTDPRAKQVELDDVSLMMMGAYCCGSLWEDLTHKGVTQMADFAILRVLTFLEKKQIRPDVPLSIQLVKGVSDIDLVKNPIIKLFNKMFGRDLDLNTNRHILDSGEDTVYEWKLFGRESRTIYGKR